MKNYKITLLILPVALLLFFVLGNKNHSYKQKNIQESTLPVDIVQKKQKNIQESTLPVDIVQKKQKNIQESTLPIDIVQKKYPYGLSEIIMTNSFKEYLRDNPYDKDYIDYRLRILNKIKLCIGDKEPNGRIEVNLQYVMDIESGTAVGTDVIDSFPGKGNYPGEIKSINGIKDNERELVVNCITSAHMDEPLGIKETINKMMKELNLTIDQIQENNELSQPTIFIFPIEDDFVYDKIKKYNSM